MNATKAITLHLDPSDYELLEAEAQQRGIPPDTLARDYVRAGLNSDGTAVEWRRQIGLEALRGLAALRERLPEAEPIDVVQIIREGRDDLIRRVTLT